MIRSSPLSALSTSSPEQTQSQGYESPFLIKPSSNSGLSGSYRPSKPLPFELQERCRIFFEENLHSQAISLLTSLLTSGNSTWSSIQSQPAMVPPASHLALAATLAIHPGMTTKTRRSERVQASIEALQYLRLLHSCIGPLNAMFNVAYAYAKSDQVTRRGRLSRREDEGSETAVHDAITLDMAESGSVWARAGDFWSTVGWAFNCSIWHRKRWEIWLPWLQHVIDVLESDWKDRKVAGSINESLIMKYIGQPQSRRVLRAVFANGKKESMSEFGEIWNKETTEKKEKSKSYEKIKVDFETEEFGNYFNVSSEESSEAEVDNQDANGFDGAEDDLEDNLTDTISNPTIPDGTSELGGTSAISMRMRLFALLLHVSIEVPKDFTDAYSLIGLFITYARTFSLSTFTSAISISQLESFSLPAASLLLQTLAYSFLEAAAPQLDCGDLNQAILEKGYLPWAANTNGTRDNAKLAACVETLLRLYDGKVGLRWTVQLENAVKQGIEKREEKSRRATKGKGDGSGTTGQSELTWLRSSGQRMILLLQLTYRKTDTQNLQIR